MKTLKSKVGLLLGLAIVGVMTITTFNSYKDYQDIVSSRRDEVQKQVESVYNIVEGYHKLAISGKMTEAEAQKTAKEAVKMARYGGKDGKSEYFYIFNYENGLTVMHPIKTEWDGVKYAADIKTSNGILVIVDMINALKKSPDNKTFVATMFPHPGQTEAVDKLQYVRGIEGWNWMIGSGIYMDDIKSLVIDNLIKTLIVDAVILLLIVVFGVYIVKNVLKQVGGEPHEAIEVMKKIAGGNLNVSIPTNEKESLLYSMNEMVKSLAQIVSQTKSSTQEIAIAANEIAQGNMELSSRTEQTAAFLQETAASMNEIASSIASSTSAANEANSLSSEANRMAEQGGKVMGEVMVKMNAIKDSSSKITDIISVIDGIAFQTNLLALNAAVEAARAGDTGRGFAVVAGEVRQLAQRSATAAKEIKELIISSNEKVNDGAILVSKAEQSMGDIVSSVDKVKVMIHEINVAATEQSTGISQINQAISNLDGMTQQNAALVEEAAAAASSLNDQANSLSHVVDRFKV